MGLDRDRAFYPTVMIVIAAYYVLFAAMSGSVQTVVIESAVMTLFAAAAVAGFKSSAWIVVVALAGLVFERPPAARDETQPLRRTRWSCSTARTRRAAAGR